MADPALYAMNLNLLVSLQALLQERSVTRAAQRIGVSQPAMSKSLRQLRAHFDDALLVRGAGNQLVLTPRGDRLRGPLDRALEGLSRVVSAEPEFDAARSRRTFRVGMPDYMMGLLGPAITTAFLGRAPQASVLLLPVDRDAYPDELEKGDLDVVVSACLSPPSELRSEPLVVDRFACAVRSDHPALRAGSELDLETFASLPHCLIALSASTTPGSVDLALAKQGLERHIAVRVMSFLAIPHFVVGSDALVTGPRRLLEWFAATHPLRLFEPPIELHSFSYAAVWHERYESDPAHEWLRDVLYEAALPHRPDRVPQSWLVDWGEEGSALRNRIQRELAGGVPVL